MQTSLLISAENRMDWPLADTSSRSSSAEHSTAPTSSSPSRWVAASSKPITSCAAASSLLSCSFSRPWR
ncbi:hypothetical protein [Mycolicibacterium elephantis]|uniref:hypothetical protein n=1 Tax=Mycolicibacterium elephantis TaxID=81858 RepID=UPI003A898267